MTHKIVIFIILLSLTLNCKKNLFKKEAKVETQDFEMMTLNATELESEIKVLGSVSYFKKAELTSKVLGRVEKYYKEEGEKVKAGDILAKIETLNLEIQLQKDRSAVEVQEKQKKLTEAKFQMSKQRVERDISNIEKAKADVRDATSQKENIERKYKNQKELKEIGATSESELRSLETSLKSAEIALFKAEKNLSNLEIGYRDQDLKNANIEVPASKTRKHESYIKLNTSIEKAELDMSIANLNAIKKNMETTALLIKEASIRTPISGIVATRAKEKGESVKESEPIYIIVETSQVLLKYNVNESDLFRLKPKQEVKFTVDAYPDKSFKGKIHIISPLIDPQSRTVEVKVIADNKDGKLKPGMFTRGEIKDYTKQKVYIVPTKAILTANSKDTGFLFVANKEGKLFKKNITITKAIGDKSQVIGEISEGDLIATANIGAIQEGQAVPVKK